MDSNRFDALLRALALGGNRRQALRLLGLGVVAQALVARSSTVAAKPAAPVQPTSCQTDGECPPAGGDPCAGTRCVNRVCILMIVDCARGFVCCGKGACCPLANSQGASIDASATRSWRQTAGPYGLELIIGPPEPMYSPDQLATQHPTQGEVMLSGTMATPGATGMSDMEMAGMTGATPTATAELAGAPQHLELHVTEAATGRTVTNAHVTIEVVDQTSHHAMTLPIVTMQGIGAGPTDFHYGNGVRLIPGHAYAIEVAVNDQSAIFAFRYDLATPEP
jgi:hypothetical protein